MAAPSVNLVGGYKIPVIGLGTWQCDDEKELENAINVALENGYRHIDTAYVYGNEHVVGRVLQKWFSSGKLKREDLFITTKLPMEATNPDRVEPYIKKSLENLQLNYVDLYLIHFPVGTKPGVQCNKSKDCIQPLVPIPTDHVAIWRKVEEQVDAGLTRTIGISNFNIKQVATILNNARIKPASLQVENHIFLPQNELVKFCQDNGIVVVAYSPLGSPGIGTFLAKFGKADKTFPSILKDDTVKKVAEKYKKSPGQIALKFLLQRNIVVIPKSVTENRIKENINLFDFTLSEDDLATLRGLDRGEAGRIVDFCMFRELSNHPEWPFEN